MWVHESGGGNKEAGAAPAECAGEKERNKQKVRGSLTTGPEILLCGQQCAECCEDTKGTRQQDKVPAHQSLQSGR